MCTCFEPLRANDVNKTTYWDAAPARCSAPQSSLGNGAPFPQGNISGLLSAGLGNKVLEQLGWTTLRHHKLRFTSLHKERENGFLLKPGNSCCLCVGGKFCPVGFVRTEEMVTCPGSWAAACSCALRGPIEALYF